MIKKCLIILTFLFSITAISQTATYGKLSQKGKYKSYITKAGDTLTIGDKITIDLPRNDTYAFISQGGNPGGTILTGATVTITKLKTEGSKKRGFKMQAGFSGYGLLTVWIDYENALRAQEIILD